ncbi:MAG: hypothetical protein HUJ83_10570 [Veillonella sp.]|nr:hypothetical protein [Veillonella sp.]
MKKKLLFIATICLLALGCGSCVSTMPLTATSNTVGHKEGRATQRVVLGLFRSGNAGINEAAKKGGIKKISHVDVKHKDILGGIIVAETTTIVYGE